MKAKTDLLEANIEDLKAQIAEEQHRAESLRARAHASSGEDAQKALLDALNEKVASVYAMCGFDAKNAKTLTMLEELEAKLEELLEAIEAMPKEYVIQAERTKEKERRDKVRIERMKAKKEELQKKRNKSKLRAMQPAKKRQGRPIMFRARPRRKNKASQEEVVVDEKNDDDKFFEP